MIKAILHTVLLTSIALGVSLAEAEEDPRAESHRLAMEHLLNDSPDDDGPAFLILQQLAESGYPDAQYDLGIIFLQGKYVDQDLDVANSWWERAAEQGQVNAQYKLAHSYRVGRGTSINPEKAFYWYLEAAKQGDAQAQSNVITCYATGYGVGRDIDKAVFWARKVAETGDAQAYAALATFLSSDEYEKTDLVEAYSWMLILAPVAHFYSPGAQQEMNGLRATLDRKLTDEQKDEALQMAAKWLEDHPKVLGPDVQFEIEAQGKP